MLDDWQACRVVRLADRECIRTGDRALVTFEFMFRPEYLILGAVRHHSCDA